MPPPRIDDVDLSDLRLFDRGIPHAVFARLRAGAPVYFALTEIQARRLEAKMREFRLRTDAPQTAGEELDRRYQALLEAARDELVRTSTHFDEDTSGSYQPERQARWRARVEAELAETGSSAPGRRR